MVTYLIIQYFADVVIHTILTIMSRIYYHSPVGTTRHSSLSTQSSVSIWLNSNDDPFVRQYHSTSPLVPSASFHLHHLSNQSNWITAVWKPRILVTVFSDTFRNMIWIGLKWSGMRYVEMLIGEQLIVID